MFDIYYLSVVSCVYYGVKYMMFWCILIVCTAREGLEQGCKYYSKKTLEAFYVHYQSVLTLNGAHMNLFWLLYLYEYAGRDFRKVSGVFDINYPYVAAFCPDYGANMNAFCLTVLTVGMRREGERSPSTASLCSAGSLFLVFL